MLRWGIPDYRLDKEGMDVEIKAILDLGVDIKYNVKVGVDVSLGELQKEYKAVFVGIGGQLGVKLGVSGEDVPNVMSGTDFLNKVNLGEKVDIGDKVIVIGGGNTAIDAARVARRLGADVTIHYRRTKKEMPAIEHEIIAAEEEGVNIEFLSAPVEVLNDGKRATGLKCIRMKLGEPDASGRARPIPVEGSEYDVEATTIIPAVSQQPDFTGLEPLKNEKGWISVDDKSQTPVAGIFAGGDITNQLGLVTEAISLGRKSAEAIDAYLRGTELETPTPPPIIKAENMQLGYYEAIPRNEVSVLSINDRLKDFRKVASVLDGAQILDEAKRCMSCGLCFGCDLCFNYCGDSAVKKSPEGGDYKYDFDWTMCTGCKRCAEACPCGFIDMT